MHRVVVAVVIVVLGARAPMAHGQMAGMQSTLASGGVSAIPIFTWADRTAGNRALSEAYVTQPIAMGEIDHGSLSALGTLDFEGLTLRRGELSTGGWGEGFVDRRHPHSYVHEAMLGAETSVRSTAMSLFAGRGFAPFGSDDPMVRPFVKYPADHHLAQILERIVVVGAVNVGSFIAEVGTFNGDEPTGPAEGSQWGRFGDSWSTRVTWLPKPSLELSYSHANVASPESPHGGTLDQRKDAAVARFARSSGILRYAFAEWARTDDVLHGDRKFRYQALLAEAAADARVLQAALRFEHSDRPEEERLADLFRTVHPATDVSILGVSQWTTITANVTAKPFAFQALLTAPFVEASFSHVTHGTPAGLVDLTSLYGSRRLWMLSAGVRLGVGHLHERMGRYGVARPMSVMHMPAMSGEHSND